MIQIKAPTRQILDTATMTEHRLFRDVAFVTAIKLMVIAAAGWLVFGRPPKIDADSAEARLIGTPAVSSLSKEVQP
jgi:hypothetical protein